MPNDTKLVWDLQRVNKISLSFATSLEITKITRLATDGLVQYFDCAFARVWLVEPNRKMLKLFASSGLYTRTDGDFSRIPMGDFKIGRIAKNRVSLLSNQFAQEPWVRDPNWAIANQISGFAGYPLVSTDKVIGVLAAFSHDPLRPEFLQVLSNLCTTLTVALEMASQYQQERQRLQADRLQADAQAQRHSNQRHSDQRLLSESLAHILCETALTVVGTERPLDLSQTELFLQIAEKLQTLECTYCRLTYGKDSAVALEAIAEQNNWKTSLFNQLSSRAASLGGNFAINTEASIRAVQVSLSFPASSLPKGSVLPATAERAEPPQQILTEREQAVVALLVKGLRDRDIANQLHISDSTVKFHINNILTKVEAKTRIQAIYELMRLGVLAL